MSNESKAKSTLLPWGPEKKLKWFLNQKIQRSYYDDVLQPLERIRASHGASLSVEQYGSLTIDPEKYPIYGFQIGERKSKKPTVLVTGGVHGYETSGVKGALLFLEKHVWNYTEHFNFVVIPCISPWAYETINRLNPVMENPNREFKAESKSEESRLFIEYLSRLNISFDAHIDLHETTDSDKQFIPEEYSKNGMEIKPEDVSVPDGFYLIGIEGTIRKELESAMIESVRKVTHIAETDEHGMILDAPASHDGVIHSKIRGLCSEYTTANARLGAYTTEVYPDSPRYKGTDPKKVEEICCEAQVACVRGALEFWIQAR